MELEVHVWSKSSPRKGNENRNCRQTKSLVALPWIQPYDLWIFIWPKAPYHKLVKL